MGEDDTSPNLQTKVNRQDYDRFLVIARSLGRTPYSILQELVHGFCEGFFATEAGLDEELQRLWALRRRLEAGYASAFAGLITKEVEVLKGISRDSDPIDGAVKRFIATANVGDDGAVEKAVRDLQSEPERIRLAVHGRIATVLPDLWSKARPFVAGIHKYPRDKAADGGG